MPQLYETKRTKRKTAELLSRQTMSSIESSSSSTTEPQKPDDSDSGLIEYDYGDLSDMKWEEDWPNLKEPLSDEVAAGLRNLRY